MAVDMKRLYEATHVYVTKPDGTKLFTEMGPLAIVLDTGDFVWVESSYHFNDLDPEVKRVGDGRDNGYSHDGCCVHSVPSAWCRFLDDKEAEQGHTAHDLGDDPMGYWHGRNV